jgi:hypothetical protein
MATPDVAVELSESMVAALGDKREEPVPHGCLIDLMQTTDHQILPQH